MFVKNGYNIQIRFVNNRAADIVFRKAASGADAEFSDSEIKTFLLANGKDWETPKANFWHSSNPQRFAFCDPKRTVLFIQDEVVLEREITEQMVKEAEALKGF